MTEKQKSAVRLMGRASLYAGASLLSCAGLVIVSATLGLLTRVLWWAFALSWAHR